MFLVQEGNSIYMGTKSQTEGMWVVEEEEEEEEEGGQGQ